MFTSELVQNGWQAFTSLIPTPSGWDIPMEFPKPPSTAMKPKPLNQKKPSKQWCSTIFHTTCVCDKPSNSMNLAGCKEKSRGLVALSANDLTEKPSTWFVPSGRCICTRTARWLHGRRSLQLVERWWNMSLGQATILQIRKIYVPRIDSQYSWRMFRTN